MIEFYIRSNREQEAGQVLNDNGISYIATYEFGVTFFVSWEDAEKAEELLKEFSVYS